MSSTRKDIVARNVELSGMKARAAELLKSSEWVKLTERPGRKAIEPERRRHFSARQQQFYGAAGLIFYAVLSTSAAFVITGPSTHPSRELFPFFTWSLFSKVSDSRREYHIAITALDGRIFDPPVDMRSIDVFPNYSDSRSLGYKALQNLGRSLSRDAKGSDLDRERFSARFFGDHDVDYQINRHGYNPLKRWREGPSSDEVELIGSFSYKGG